VLQIRFHVSATHGPRLASDVHVSAVWNRPDVRRCGRELAEPKNPMRPIQMTIHVSKQSDLDINPHDNVDRSSFEADTPTPV
jgi:hypothetical protein